MRRILCLHLPNWPIQRVLAGRNVGQVSNLPCILHARDPRRGQLVVAASDAPKNCGIRLGMPLAEAATLAANVPGSKFKVQGSGSQRPEVRDQNSTLNFEPGTWNSALLVLPYDPAADLAELARLAEHCERFSPLVGWETAASQVQSSKFKVPSRQSPTWNLEPGTLNSLFFDVTGIGVLFGGEERLAAEVVADLARLGYTARVAIADTIGAAWAAASWKGEAPAEPRVQGSRFKVIDASTLNRELGTWNLESIRLPPETLDLFAQLGLKQIADLLPLPRASLRARFGELVLLRLDQLTGAAQETIVAHRPPPKFAVQWVLEYPAERREVIDQILHELVGRLAAELAQRREGVVQLHCRLDCAPGQPVPVEVGLFRPSADARHLWDLMRMQLDQLHLPGPVGRITLQAVATAPLENRQAELFAGGRDEANRQLALLIDRLASRLGPEAVLHPRLTSDPLPERAVQNQFKVQSSRFKVRKKVASSIWNFEPGTLNACWRPLFLREPLPLDAVSVVPDGPPITFRFQGKLHRIAAHWGPERIETGWFRGTSVRRDYYRIETDEGLRFWLFRQLGDGKWHMHGEFS